MKFRYKVTRHFSKDRIEKDLGIFIDSVTAIFFINCCREKDQDAKLDTIYLLYDEHQKENQAPRSFASQDLKPADKQGPTAQFRPTPLMMKPRPPGAMPFVSYIEDKDEKDEKK